MALRAGLSARMMYRMYHSSGFVAGDWAVVSRN